MKSFTQKELSIGLSKIGIKKNSTILIHSGINYLGIMDKIANNKIPEKIFKILSKTVGKNGTLLFPGFFYNYARKKIFFDLKHSKPCKSLGVISQYVFETKKIYRSKNPLTSLMGVGKNAKGICKESNSRSYEYNSVWDKLFKSNAEILFLGVPLSESMSFIHYLENIIGVPHMYTKKILLPIKTDNKVIENFAMVYVRYLDFNINVNLKQFEIDLYKEGIIREFKIGDGFIKAVNVKKVFAFAINKLTKNPYYFLNNVPKFNNKKYPIK